jgi:hypothetical protein
LPAISRSAVSVNASASSRGASVTASPRVIRPRIASWSRVIETRRGSKPAARQARTIRPSGVGGGPVVVGEVADAHRLLAGESMVGRKGDEERLAHEVALLGAFELASRECGVLEVDGEMELSGADAFGQFVGGALLHRDPGVRMGGADLRDGRGHQARESGREGADAQERPLVVGDLGELKGGEVEAHGDRVGVLEQERAGRGELQPARPAIQQARADLLLERRDLV